MLFSLLGLEKNTCERQGSDLEVTSFTSTCPSKQPICENGLRYNCLFHFGFCLEFHFVISNYGKEQALFYLWLYCGFKRKRAQLRGIFSKNIKRIS